MGERKPPAEDTARNEVSGAADNVIQAHDVQGGIRIRQVRTAPRWPVPRQLPSDVLHFVDRDTEIGELDALLDEPGGHARRLALGLSVITGIAGLGKTSLAVHWAHRVRHRFPDGDLYVNLRGHSPEPPVTPEQALDGLLRALDVPAEKIPRGGVDDLAGLYRSLLAQRRLLVLLDNAAGTQQVRPLLPGSPTCLVIVTSRSRLSGLIAREGGHRIALDVLSPGESLTLLRRVAGTDRVNADSGTASELARRCGYLPLALRIVSERAAAPHVSIMDLVEELAVEHDRLDVLATHDDETTEVRTVFSWSYHSLPTESARVFRLLGLHSGPEIGIPAAAALTGTTAGETRRQLDVLTGLNLLEQVGRARYRFHDLLRTYAAERAESDESPDNREAAIRRVLGWYLHTASAAQRALYPQRHHLALEPPDQDVQPLSFASRDDALNWYDLERANLVAAVRQASDTNRYSVAWRLTIVLGSFLALRSHWADKITVQRIGIAAASTDRDRKGESWLLGSLGETYSDLQKFDEAAPSFQRALGIAREIGDRWLEAANLHGLGIAHLGLGRFREATEHFHLASAAFHDIDDQRGEAVALEYLGDVLRRQRRFDEAIDHLRRSLNMHQRSGDRPREAWSLRQLGLVHLDLQKFDVAITHFRQALAIYRDLGDHNYVAQTLIDLGDALRGNGQIVEARAMWSEAADLSNDSPHSVQIRARIADIDRDAPDKDQ